MKAIILAAGMGTRLGDLTTNTPKCLMQIRGETLLAKQVAAYRANGIEEVVIVRGYLSEQVTAEGATYFENEEYARTGLLASLFCAEDAMEEGFVFSYADTTWRSEHVKAILDTLEGTEDMAVVTDTAWMEAYDGRDQHPVTEAECVEVNEEGLVIAAGKVVTPERAHGEVAGMGGLSAAAAKRFVEAFRELSSGPEGLDVPFGQKDSLRYAYVVDLMLHIADRAGVSFRTADVKGGWREIDTPQDLERAQTAVNW